MKTKTIDINAKEWFDKVNGNSYFAGTITLNYGMKSEKIILLPFQYGYGDFYMQEAKAVLTEHNHVSCEYMQGLRRYCKENNIILRSTKQRNCKKRELKNNK